MLELERQLSAKLNEVFERERATVIEEIDELWQRKAADYDQEQGVMQRSPFGEASFLHELAKKVGRLIASWKREEPLAGENVDEQLRDIANYAVGLIAYRRALDVLAAADLKFVKRESASAE